MIYQFLDIRWHVKLPSHRVLSQSEKMANLSFGLPVHRDTMYNKSIANMLVLRGSEVDKGIEWTLLLISKFHHGID